MGFANAPTAVLLTIRDNLLRGLDEVAGHVDAGTFTTIAPGKSTPPSQSGQLTRILLEELEAELSTRMDAHPVVLCDVDGTVALMGKGEAGRRRFYDWHRVGEDDPNQPIINLVNVLRAGGYPIVFVSGRDEVCRDATWTWLIRRRVAEEGELLFMRARKDNRPDNEVKLEIYRREIEPRWPVAWVLDDRDQVVQMWRSLGLTVLQVAPGGF